MKDDTFWGGHKYTALTLTDYKAPTPSLPHQTPDVLQLPLKKTGLSYSPAFSSYIYHLYNVLANNSRPMLLTPHSHPHPRASLAF